MPGDDPAPLRHTRDELVPDTRAEISPPSAPRPVLRCTHCGGDLQRSRLRPFERVIRAIIKTRRPFRCRDCGWRRWRASL